MTNDEILDILLSKTKSGELRWEEKYNQRYYFWTAVPYAEIICVKCDEYESYVSIKNSDESLFLTIRRGKTKDLYNLIKEVIRKEDECKRVKLEEDTRKWLKEVVFK